jgi:hypothetical protein
MTGDSRNAALESVIMPRTRDLGDGFEVHRALPSAQRRIVGPFVFFDQMGPVILGEGRGLDVRPHLHIGLATVTYLFDGEILHRDSLGNTQPIRPGAVNWMTAGRGIVHSERTSPELRAGGSSLFGIQTWVALPKGSTASERRSRSSRRCSMPTPRFRARLGSTFQRNMKSGQPGSPRGRIEVGGDLFDAGQLLVFRPGEAVAIKAPDRARLILFGGEAMDARHVWWNFVSSSAARIEQAKADWKAGRFGKVPGDETEFIPRPEE